MSLIPAFIRKLACATALLAGLAVTGAAQAQTWWDAGVWETYKTRFISDEGRVIDDANKDISHSEGQGYGMLLAVFADDPLTFAKVWTWTSRELYVRGDDLAAWRWDPAKVPHVTDVNNATDGDILIAWALAAAAERWSMPALAAQARKIALAVGRKAMARSSYGPALRPGMAGFETLDGEDGPVVNLSYWVYPAFDALRAVAPEIDWSSLRNSGLALTKASRFGPAKLPSDWVSLRQQKPAPAKAFPAQFSYNSIRIPLYLVWGGVTDAHLLAPYAELWRGLGEASPDVIDVISGKPAESFKDNGYRMVPALIACALKGRRVSDEIRKVTFEHYYPATLQMLALVAARQQVPQCL